MAYRKAVQGSETQRRRGGDGSRMASDIHLYRWFALFLNVAKELEKKNIKIEVLDKKYSVKINRSHHWFKKINVDRFPNISFLNFEIKNFYSKTKNFFDGYFWSRYRHLFQEPKTELVSSVKDIDTEKFDVVVFPKHFTVRERRDDLQAIFQNLETRTNRKTRSKKTENRFKADISLPHTKDDLLKRLFHTFRIHHTKKKNMTILDVFSHYQNQIYKSPLIQIQKEIKHRSIQSSDRYATRPTTNKSRYDAQVRSTFRDIKYSKFLILNLCKGHFPVYDKLL